MSEQLRHALALSLIKGVGIHTLRKLLDHFESPRAIFENSSTELSAAHNLPPDLLKSIASRSTFGAADEILSQCERLHIRVLFIEDEAYPPLLKHIQLPPVLIYVKGDLSTLQQTTSVGIIGTRRMTRYGEQQIRSICESLSSHQVSLVSGLGDGIERFATEQALHYGLGGVVVYPAGLQHPYPSNVALRLIEEVQEKGCILSEHPPEALLQKHAFLARHRLTVGLSQQLVLIESDLSGGSMQVARLAQTENRDVHAVPGDVDKKRSRGANLLIRSNVAQLLSSTEDLLFSLNLPSSSSVEQPLSSTWSRLSGDEKKVMDTLTESPEAMHIDEIAKKNAMSMDQLSFLLFNLECQHMIELLPGNLYRIFRPHMAK